MRQEKLKLNRSILIEAEDIVNGIEQDVNRKYGDPKEVFQVYADIFELIAPKERCFTEGKINALGVAYIQICIKLGRERVSHKVDNLVDLCGYAEIANQINEI